MNWFSISCSQENHFHSISDISSPAWNIPSDAAFIVQCHRSPNTIFVLPSSQARIFTEKLFTPTFKR
ncbi:hypothetical protein CDAR_73491 [Caerostris darwini]|uniref:Uncharacterized protein n=1 Tax=Caerostris darwini TaxID=1538125 RepID=A0AAV4VL66_9ARAC|nr:hypothetical protein CDAR_73491 [Caerostris darwini]